MPARISPRADTLLAGSRRDRGAVHGQKIWTSLARESDWIFVLARSEPGSRGGKGLFSSDVGVVSRR